MVNNILGQATGIVYCGGRYNKYIELNPALISNNYADLYNNYITNISNIDYILLTI